MEEQLFSEKTQIERKLFYFDLKQNPRGRFLKITEDVRGRRDTIIIPSTGLVEIKEILERVIASEQDLEPFYDEDEDDDEYDDEDDAQGNYDDSSDDDEDEEDEDDEESPSFSEVFKKN
jgi:hypothetical protein